MTANPKPFTNHLIIRSQKKKSVRRTVLVSLTLTSMVDMFSLLVIFLLQTFSTSPELIMVSKGVVLPSSATAQEIRDAPVLSLTSQGVYLDHKYVGPLDHLLVNPSNLIRGLTKQRSLWQKTHPKEIFKGEISLQAHKDIPSTVVAYFMALLPAQNFGSIQLAVSGGTL